MNPHRQAARAISDYLLTGMHHTTVEGQDAIAAIITRSEEKPRFTAEECPCGEIPISAPQDTATFKD